MSVESLQCQHILLGYYHHSHLARLLQPYKENLVDLHRITLLKTTDFAAEQALKPYNVVEFPSVFQSTDDIAVDSFKPNSSKVGYSASSDLTEDSEQPTNHDWPVTRKSSNSSISQPRNNSAGAGMSLGKHSSTWNPNQGIVLLNLNDDRIDANLGNWNPDTERSLFKRADHCRLCNDFHLRGVCYASSCSYSHEPRLNPEELVILRSWARRLPCHKKSACRSAECWYGHMCPHETCFLPNTCRFRAYHDMDRTAVTVWQKSGTRAWLPRESNDRLTTGLLSDDSLRL